MAFPESTQLQEFLAPHLRRRGLDIEHIKTTRAGKKSQVIVYVDGDTRPSSDVLEEVSREISALFDAAEDQHTFNFGPGYTLEVSTPGVDLPLSAPRHFRRNRGRLMTAQFAADGAAADNAAADGASAGAPARWRIGALDESETSVILVAEEKKHLRVIAQRLENITSAMVEIEFTQPKASELAVCEMDFDQAVAQYLAE